MLMLSAALSQMQRFWSLIHDSCVPERQYTDFHLNVLFLWLDCPLSGAIDIGILHSLYNQLQKR
jgi:hypothetical protein